MGRNDLDAIGKKSDTSDNLRQLLLNSDGVGGPFRSLEWVNRYRAEPTADLATYAMPRLQPILAIKNRDVPSAAVRQILR